MTMAMVMAMVMAIAIAMAMAMTMTIVINQSMCRLLKLTSPFQVIITIAWLIGVTSNIPTFIHLKVTNGLCYETWPDDWKIRTYNIFLTTQVCVALSVMVTLYSRVVFALWFKRNGTNAVTPQQKVSADKLVCKKSDTGFYIANFMFTYSHFHLSYRLFGIFWLYVARNTLKMET